MEPDGWKIEEWEQQYKEEKKRQRKRISEEHVVLVIECCFPLFSVLWKDNCDYMVPPEAHLWSQIISKKQQKQKQKKPKQPYSSAFQ